MYKNKKIMAFIPARGGSKSIIGKNLSLFNGKPLLYYTFKTALETPSIDDIYISTDNTEIADYTTHFSNKIQIINRPKELSLDTSKTIEAVMHALKELKSKNKIYDYMIILQPTSPLRQVFHIEEIIKQGIDNNQDDIVSIHKIQHNPVLTRYRDHGMLIHPILNTTSTVRRQDMKTPYYVNGLLYFYKIADLTLETSLNDARYGYEVEEKYCPDINRLLDIDLCSIFPFFKDNK